MSKICMSAILCATSMAFTAPAFAQAQSIRVGGLTCDAAPRVGLVVGSRQNLRCVFRSNETGRQYNYRATISRVGLDIGVTGGGRLFWGVFALPRTSGTEFCEARTLGRAVTHPSVPVLA